jgi:hypothetical protein
MYSAGTGAHAISGDILSKYAALGWENGLGYPTCDAQSIPSGQLQLFQNGDIWWTAQRGAHEVMYPKVGGAGVAYSPAAGTDFGPNGPAYTDVQQGGEADCWLMASLAATAASVPADLTNMFTYDGTISENGSPVSLYTVRFYDNSNSHAAQYVLVDTKLPGGGSVYDHPVNGVLWAALAEKAYAEANGLGYVTGRITNSNAYDALGNTADAQGYAGGLCTWALQAITGNQDSSTNPSDMSSAWQAHKIVVLATPKTPGPNASSYIVSWHVYALVGYQLVGYNPSDPTNLVQYHVYNPWGTDSNGWAPNNTNTKYGLFWTNPQFLSDNFCSQSAVAGVAPAVAAPARTFEATRAFPSPAALDAFSVPPPAASPAGVTGVMIGADQVDAAFTHAGPGSRTNRLLDFVRPRQDKAARGRSSAHALDADEPAEALSLTRG